MNQFVYYQIYNFQPGNFTLLNDTREETLGYNATLMKDSWNSGFKVFFLRWLNQGSNPYFTLDPKAYSWIDPRIRVSTTTFKFDLYDKFGIINLMPDFTRNELIELLG